MAHLEDAGEAPTPRTINLDQIKIENLEDDGNMESQRDELKLVTLLSN